MALNEERVLLYTRAMCDIFSLRAKEGNKLLCNEKREWTAIPACIILRYTGNRCKESKVMKQRGADSVA